MGGKPTSLKPTKMASSPSSPATQSPNRSPSVRGNGAANGRQASPSSHSVRSTGTYGQHPIVLSDSEKQLIKRSWRHLQKPSSSLTGSSVKSKSGSGVGVNGCSADSCSDSSDTLSSVAASRHLDELGVLIFLRIFEIAPETRDAFPMFRRFTDRSALVGNVVFRCHGRRFVRAVQSVVENIDSLDVVARPNLELLGRRHRDFPGFHARYLVYETAMDDIWRSQLGRRRYGPATRRAWRKVFRLITSTVNEGYVDDTDGNTGKECCPSAASTPRIAPATTNGGNGCASPLAMSCPVASQTCT
jgi:Globin